MFCLTFSPFINSIVHLDREYGFFLLSLLLMIDDVDTIHANVNICYTTCRNVDEISVFVNYRSSNIFRLIEEDC